MQHLEPEALPQSAELGVHDLIITLHGTHFILHGTQTRCLTRLQLLTEHITSHLNTLQYVTLSYIVHNTLHVAWHYILHHTSHFTRHYILQYALHYTLPYTSHCIF